MRTIDHPTTRRLVYGCNGYRRNGDSHGPVVATDTPRLQLQEIESGWHYSTKPVNDLCFTAQTAADLAVLDGFYRRDAHLPGRFGSWERYRATIAGIRALLAELAWQLTAEERRLVDSLEAYVSQAQAA